MTLISMGNRSLFPRAIAECLRERCDGFRREGCVEDRKARERTADRISCRAFLAKAAGIAATRKATRNQRTDTRPICSIMVQFSLGRSRRSMISVSRRECDDSSFSPSCS